MDVLNTSFFYIISINFNSLAPARNKSIYLLLVPVLILHSQPLLHFFNNLAIAPKHFPTDGTFRVPKYGNLRE
jgi:hypothetical protein